MIRKVFSSAGLFLLAISGATAQAQLSLYTAVDLARRNSTSVRTAQADVQRARAAVSEARDVYLPAATVGSSAGYSYGFPIGQPSIVTAQVSSLAVSFSQPDYIRAARAGLQTANLQLRDALDQVELEASLDYLQLNTIGQQLAAYSEEKSYAERLGAIEQERVNAGVETEIAATRAELTAAQADLRRLDLHSQAALLRERLANLTGLTPASIEPEPETVPGVVPDEVRANRKELASVHAGYSNATSRSYAAHGDERFLLRPQIGFGFTYSLFDTTVNNYNLYYNHKLQANNFSVGVQISVPLYDPVRAARARESAADAVHANLQAEQGRETADEQVIQLERSLPTLRAQARIADLQEQLAGQQLGAVLLQLASPPTAPNAAPLTPADEMQARIEERARFADALEVRFTLLKAQLSLLRATGELEPWINRGAR